MKLHLPIGVQIHSQIAVRIALIQESKNRWFPLRSRNSGKPAKLARFPVPCMISPSFTITKSYQTAASYHQDMCVTIVCLGAILACWPLLWCMCIAARQDCWFLLSLGSLQMKAAGSFWVRSILSLLSPTSKLYVIFIISTYFYLQEVTKFNNNILDCFISFYPLLNNSVLFIHLILREHPGGGNEKIR